MGLWDKIKQAKNFITGGAADVGLEVHADSIRRGQDFTVRVTAQLHDQDLNVARVYVVVRGQETVRAHDRDYHDGRTRSETVRNTTTTFSQELNVADACTLKAGQHYDWTARVSIPVSHNPTYNGQNAWHEYEISAGLDVPGNDPDSKWVKVHVD